jgi:nitroreductase
MKFDLAMTDELLATTRAVRKRLDLDRKVPRELIMECLELAVQAPTGSNSQGWRWLIVDDPKKKQALADLYRKGGEAYLSQAGEAAKQAGNVQTQRVYDSAMYLIDILHKVPMHVIPCLEGRPPEGTPTVALAGYFGSIYPAVWSFQLARVQRPGTC